MTDYLAFPLVMTGWVVDYLSFERLVNATHLTMISVWPVGLQL